MYSFRGIPLKRGQVIRLFSDDQRILCKQNMDDKFFFLQRVPMNMFQNSVAKKVVFHVQF